MTLEKMAQSAARYSDRYDEFEKTENDDGVMVYQEDALHYLNVFTDAINEAYFEIARNYGKPDVYADVTVDDTAHVDLLNLDPLPMTVKNLLTSDRETAVEFKFETRYELFVPDRKGETLTIYYQYLPDRLTSLGDEPIFPESQADPMIYIALAVARIWLSEKKIDLFNTWMGQYYQLMKQVRSNMKSSSQRAIPRRMFR